VRRSTPVKALGDTVNMSTKEASMKIVGRRVMSQGGLAAAGPFLDLVIRLRRDKPFLPRGVHCFRSFEESHAWSIQMMARCPKHAHRA